MTAVADPPVRAAGRDGGVGSRAGAARPGPAPGTTQIVQVTLAVPPLHGWSWAAVQVLTPTPSAVPRGHGWGWATGRPGRGWAVAGAPSLRRPAGHPGALGSPGHGRSASVRRPDPVGSPGGRRFARVVALVVVAAGGKLQEWGRRYLLAEVVGTASALTAALGVHALTGSLASAALAGSVAETVGYYGVVLRRTLPALYARHAGADPLRRLARTAASLVAEVSDFLAAEFADTFMIRPALIYLAADWSGFGVAGGLLVGKLLADIGFYAVVIPSYELRKKVIHR